MIHSNINSEEWSLMAIESLFDRGDISDWREFAAAMRSRASGSRATRCSSASILTTLAPSPSRDFSWSIITGG